MLWSQATNVYNIFQIIPDRCTTNIIWAFIYRWHANLNGHYFKLTLSCWKHWNIFLLVGYYFNLNDALTYDLPVAYQKNVWLVFLYFIGWFFCQLNYFYQYLFPSRSSMAIVISYLCSHVMCNVDLFNLLNFVFASSNNACLEKEYGLWSTFL